ncbi:MAG: hypothetical protein CMJ84_12125 [Planctomycetes bacterium]|nr:hypothetical protein [Planctomycetota bacterium]
MDVNEHTVIEFRAAYAKDRAAGCLQGLDHYQALFSGCDDVIAREFERLAGDDGEAPDDDLLATSLMGATVRETTADASTGRRTESTSPYRLDENLGPYQLEEELGRGGQGVVYRATDTRMGRAVALKILRHLGPGAEQILERFKREAQAAAKTEHPGVCPVYDAGIEDGIPYIAMRYVEGRTLAKCISETLQDAGTREDTMVVDFEVHEEQASPPATSSPTPTGPQNRSDVMQAVLLVEQTARALHAVHEAGVIHRDVKPGNVMVTPSGEAVVMDFGLARDERSDLETLTRTGDLFGTPAYMSPEQLRSQKELDRRTDVWSLGVVLYECLTLVRPFRSTSREGLYQAILTKEPDSPRRVNPSIPKDLAVVIASALEKETDRRYQTSLDLAEDLRRVREYEPILAKPTPRRIRLTRWSQRNPGLAAALGGLLLVLSAGLGTSLLFLGQSLKEQTEKQKALAALSDLKADTDAALDAYAEALEKEQVRNERAETANRTRLQTLESEKTELQKKLAAANALLKESEELRRATETDLEVSRKRIAAIEEERDRLRKELEGLRKSLSAVSGSEKLERLKQEVTRLSRQVQSLERTKADLQERLSKEESDRKAREVTNARLVELKNELERRLMQLTAKPPDAGSAPAKPPASKKAANLRTLQLVNRFSHPIRIRSVVARLPGGTETQVTIPGGDISSASRTTQVSIPRGTTSVAITFWRFDWRNRRFLRRNVVVTQRISGKSTTVELR